MARRNEPIKLSRIILIALMLAIIAIAVIAIIKNNTEVETPEKPQTNTAIKVTGKKYLANITTLKTINGSTAPSEDEKKAFEDHIKETYEGALVKFTSEKAFTITDADGKTLVKVTDAKAVRTSTGNTITGTLENGNKVTVIISSTKITFTSEKYKDHKDMSFSMDFALDSSIDVAGNKYIIDMSTLNIIKGTENPTEDEQKAYKDFLTTAYEKVALEFTSEKTFKITDKNGTVLLEATEDNTKRNTNTFTVTVANGDDEDEKNDVTVTLVVSSSQATFISNKDAEHKNMSFTVALKLDTTIKATGNKYKIDTNTVTVMDGANRPTDDDKNAFKSYVVEAFKNATIEFTSEKAFKLVNEKGEVVLEITDSDAVRTSNTITATIPDGDDNAANNDKATVVVLKDKVNFISGKFAEHKGMFFTSIFNIVTEEVIEVKDNEYKADFDNFNFAWDEEVSEPTADQKTNFENHIKTLYKDAVIKFTSEKAFTITGTNNQNADMTVTDDKAVREGNAITVETENGVITVVIGEDKVTVTSDLYKEWNMYFVLDFAIVKAETSGSQE